MFYGDWDATYPNDAELDTSIAIQLEDGTIWARFRKGKSNRAMYRKPGEKPLVYQDFGETIPGLLEEMNVRPIKLGTGKINLNFSMQDDPIFMVHESKPAKAQWIGRLYGAHIINSTLRIMAKDKRSLESDKKTAEDDEAKLRTELANYEGLDEQSDALDKAGALLKLLGGLNDCQASLTTIMRDHEAIKRGAHFLEADTDGMRIAVARLDDLMVAQDISLSVQREEWALAHAKSLNADTASLRADLGLLEVARVQLDEYRKLAAEFESSTKDRHAITNRMEGIIPMLEKHRKDIKDTLFAEGRCPLCQSKPKKLDMDAVAANLKELVR
jgi:hypothetical protein